jgi:hypothetical protein
MEFCFVSHGSDVTGAKVVNAAAFIKWVCHVFDTELNDVLEHYLFFVK